MRLAYHLNFSHQKLLMLMERQGFTCPLSIGGATTSPAHTSVKIDPAYSGPVLYVKDASRAVGVASKLLSDERDAYHRSIRDDHETKRKAHAGKAPKKLLSIVDANARAANLTFDPSPIITPNSIGRIVLNDYPLDALLNTTDWMPFFNAWEFSGRFPDILNDPRKGPEARQLFKAPKACLIESSTKSGCGQTRLQAAFQHILKAIALSF